MADYTIETKGLDELIERMKMFPSKLKQIAEIGMQATLLVLWENVPPYPRPPEDSSYRRTGTLGRTLGSSETGGKAGSAPQTYQVRKMGSGLVEGRFGTNLGYAPYVIGDDTQAWMHKGRWWQMKNILAAAQDKINKVWNGIAQKMADFLNSSGSGLAGK